MRGGPVMPERFDGSPAKIEELKANIARSGAAGRIISDDQRSSMIVVPLLDRYADSGEPIDYLKLSRALEEQVRAKGTGKFRVYIVGFGKLVGDLIEGLDDGDLLLRDLGRDRGAVRVPLHPLPAQHRRAGRHRGARRDVADGPAADPRLRARSLFDPGALPAVRDRPVARRAEDERHHAGRGPRHAQVRRRALHLPAPVPGRPDGAPDQRGRLHGADHHRHPGDPRPGGDDQHRRHRADLHEAGADPGAAVVHRRQPEGRAALAECRRGRAGRALRDGPRVGRAGAADRAALGPGRHRGGGAARRRRA